MTIIIYEVLLEDRLHDYIRQSWEYSTTIGNRGIWRKTSASHQHTNRSTNLAAYYYNQKIKAVHVHVHGDKFGHGGGIQRTIIYY